MSRAPTKTVQMACLTIGYTDYLLPSAKAMKVAELMQEAVECRPGFDSTQATYTLLQRPVNVAFTLVRPNQVRMPQSETSPLPAEPRQIR